MIKKKHALKHALAPLLACLCLALFACGNNADQAGSPAPEDAAIAVSGLPAGAFALTSEQLKNDFEITELEALSINSKGVEKWVQAKGVLLEAVLQQRGASLADFESVAAEASDGYMITIPETVLRSRDILVAFETDGESIPPRFVVPGERAMYWVKQLSSIELIGPAREEAVTREISLSALIEQLREQARDYQHKDADCKALPLAVLLAEIEADKADFVTIRSADGLTKSEKYDTFAAQVLVIEGTSEAPLYTGPDLPSGMRVKNVESIQINGVLVK